MIPGVGFFYSGLLRRKNALSMIWASMMTLAVVSFQASFPHISCSPHSKLTGCTVVLLGVSASAFTSRIFLHSTKTPSSYSLAFSDTASAYIGDLSAYMGCLRSRYLSKHALRCRVLWVEGCSRTAFNRQLQGPGPCFLCLPAHVRGHHVRLSAFC